MVTALLFGFSCLFFIMAHSTLILYKSKDSGIISVKELIFPWPQNGKFVSLICLVLSLVFLGVAIKIPSDFKLNSMAMWRIIISTIVVPTVIYVNYISKRISMGTDGIFFNASAPTKNDWAMPMFVIVVVSFVFLAFE